ncbi:synaptonemal complex protein 3-like [Sardina pilchardus]|uniref:synaptonemal complex protein 3-like n=1 Tax=Sardina pilchardus TaxID=27697 RepID=UPI002E10721C
MASKRPHLEKNDDTTAASKRSRQLMSNEDFLPGENFRTMIDQFGANVNQAFLAKKKQLHAFTSSSLKTSNQKMVQLWQNQQRERGQLTKDYTSQFNAVFQQWKTDVQKSKEMDEKLVNMFQHQQNMFQHMRAAQGQRLKTLKHLMDQYIQSLQEVEKTHSEEQGVLLTDLRQEMSAYQKNMLIVTQKQEMASVRKSLQSMLM